MTCQECAGFLFEEMDGGALDRAAVVHLSECEGCRGLARELRANAAALRSMRDDVVPSRLEMSPNVLPMRTARKPREHLYWLAAAAAMVVGLGLGVMRLNQAGSSEVVQQATTTRPHVAEALPAIAQVAEPLPALQVRAKNREEREQRQASRSQRQLARLDADRRPVSAGSQTALKIVTADPNVVIYWLGADTNMEANDEGKIL